MASQLDTKALMSTAIFTPIPSTFFTPNPPQEREHILRRIITNIEQQNSVVRQNIITQGRAMLAGTKSRSRAQTLSASNGHDADEMAIDAENTAAHPNEISEASLDALVKSLNTPHKRGEDIYALKPLQPNGNSTAPVLESTTTASSTHPATTLHFTNIPALDSTLHTFDTHTTRTLNFYRNALIRLLDREDRKDEATAIRASMATEVVAVPGSADTRSAPSSAPTSRRPSMHTPAPPSRPSSRRPSMQTSVPPAPLAGMKRPAPPSRSGSINESRDPRRRPSVPGQGVGVNANGVAGGGAGAGSGGGKNAGTGRSTTIDRTRDPRLARRPD